MTMFVHLEHTVISAVVHEVSLCALLHSFFTLLHAPHGLTRTLCTEEPASEYIVKIVICLLLKTITF